MKRKILNLLVVAICVPILMFCACSNKRSSLPKVDASVYFQESVQASIYNNTKTKDIKLSDLTKSSVDELNLDSYVEIKLTANNTWIYKMYIDRIYFKVYTTEATGTEMIVNVSITNLADEDDMSHPSDDFSIPCSFIPKKNGSTICYVDVEKTVATATGCTITFDIYNSTSGTVADNNGNLTSFRWLIYDLEFYAEHRAY